SNRTPPLPLHHEPKALRTLAARHAAKTAAETISVMLAIFARIKPALRKSITFDNDTAFAQHGLLQSMRAMATWFCDAYASWQKGGVENANGRFLYQILRIGSAFAIGEFQANFIKIHAIAEFRHER